MKESSRNKRAILIAIFMLASIVTAMAQSATTTWQYKEIVLSLPVTFTDMDYELRVAGEDGWELAQIVQIEKQLWLIFKRPIVRSY